MKAKSQNQQILEYLKKGKRIHPIGALKQFGCFRLASRIKDLRNSGHDIKGKMVTKSDKTFKVYWMDAEKAKS